MKFSEPIEKLAQELSTAIINKNEIEYYEIMERNTNIFVQITTGVKYERLRRNWT
jgi:hypothetical protein